MDMRTPLKTVRHLGSAKEGTGHFLKQRITAIANAFLVMFLVWFIAKIQGASYSEAKSLLQSPLVAVPLLLLLISGTVHMRIGMQVIIEDYVHSEGWKLMLLIANTFFAVVIAMVSIFAVLKLSFGG